MKKLLIGIIALLSVSNIYAQSTTVVKEGLPYIKTIKLNNSLGGSLFSGNFNPDLVCKMNDAGKLVKATFEKIEFEHIPGFKEMPLMKTISGALQEEVTELIYESKTPKLHPKTCIAWSPIYANDEAEFYRAEEGWKCTKYQAAYYGTVYSVKVLDTVTCDTGKIVNEITLNYPRSPDGHRILGCLGDIKVCQPETDRVCKTLGYDLSKSQLSLQFPTFKKTKISHVFVNTTNWETLKGRYPILYNQIICLEIN